MDLGLPLALLGRRLGVAASGHPWQGAEVVDYRLEAAGCQPAPRPRPQVDLTPGGIRWTEPATAPRSARSSGPRRGRLRGRGRAGRRTRGAGGGKARRTPIRHRRCFLTNSCAEPSPSAACSSKPLPRRRAAGPGRPGCRAFPICHPAPRSRSVDGDAPHGGQTSRVPSPLFDRILIFGTANHSGRQLTTPIRICA